MYNMAKDTYECDFCGWEEPWDAGDDDYGSSGIRWCMRPTWT